MGKCRGEGHAAPPSVSPLAQNDDITRERGGGWVAKSKHRQYGGKEEGVDELFILCTPTPGFTQKRVFLPAAVRPSGHRVIVVVVAVDVVFVVVGELLLI